MPALATFCATFFMSQGARNWPFLTLMARPVFGRGHEQIGLAAQEGRDLQHIDRLGDGRALLGQMHVGQHRAAIALAHLGEDRQARLEPQPARALDRGAVRLVERGLVDEADAEPSPVSSTSAWLISCAWLPALERARAGDQRQRPVVAEREIADMDMMRHGRLSSAGVPSSKALTRSATPGVWSSAALMNDVNSGCGSNGFDFSSGWNCTPMNQGWSGISTISGSSPSGDMPEKRRPVRSSRSL